MNRSKVNLQFLSKSFIFTFP